MLRDDVEVSIQTDDGTDGQRPDDDDGTDDWTDGRRTDDDHGTDTTERKDGQAHTTGRTDKEQTTTTGRTDGQRTTTGRTTYSSEVSNQFENAKKPT